MSEGLKAVVDELRRLQRDGVRHVFISDHTLEQLRSLKGSDSGQKKADVGSSPKNPPASDNSMANNALKTQTVEASKPAPAAFRMAPIPETVPEIELPEGEPEAQLDWLRGQVLACPVCNEHLSEHGKVVFGTGSPTADIFFCGEAPGADEERVGEPFVGPAGKLLTKIIAAMSLRREDVYIANILKWRPEHEQRFGNRPPTIEEMRYCRPYVESQIQIIRPKVIVALGNSAVSGLLGPDPTRKMGAIRGTWDRFMDVPVMITFHPSYLLRNGTLRTKRLVWEDMLKVMEKCQLEISPRQRDFFRPKN